MGKKETKSKHEAVETKEFVMTTTEGKKMKVHAPVESLDEEGHAGEALTGVYRHG